MRLLAIESSCDETSAAIIEDSSVRSVVVSSQIKIHAEYGGVVPELATREHLANLQPVVRKHWFKPVLQHRSSTPSVRLKGRACLALMIGWKAAQSMAFALKVPFIGVNHVEAHCIRRGSKGIRREPAGRVFSQIFHWLAVAATPC